MTQQPNFLSRDAILGCDDSATEIVHVPQWGGDVRIKSLTGRERDRIEAHVIGNDGKAKLADLRARVVAASVIDENDEPLFGQADVSALSGKNAAALDTIFTAAQRISALSDEDVEDLTGE